MEFSIECQLPLSARDMWRIRASAGFRRHVVEDGLLKKLDCISTSKGPDEEGYHKRTQRYVPTKVDCPDFLRRVIGDALFDVTDEQKWSDSNDSDDNSEYCQYYSIRPTHLANFCVTTGVLKLTSVSDNNNTNNNISDDDDLDDVTDDECESDVSQSSSDGDTTPISPSFLSYVPPHERCTHLVEGTTKVNLPALGWAAERSIVHNLRLFYELYPSTVGNFRKKLYEKFSNGNPNLSISEVIDRFLKHEEETESVSDETSSSASVDDNDMAVEEEVGTGLDLGNLGSKMQMPSEFDRRGKSLEEELEQLFV